MKKYFINSDSAIVKGFDVIEVSPNCSDEQSDQAIEEPNDNIEKPLEEEINLDEWTFFNQSDDYVSKVLDEMENTEKPPEEELNLDDWMFFNQSDDYVSKVLEEMESTEKDNSQA